MIDIRPLEKTDEPAWRRLWTGYLAFYETSASETVFATTFTRLISADVPDMHGRLAIADGVAVGLVHFLFHRHCWRVEDVIYLQDLFVSPSHRGTGAGRALIEAVYAEADAAGCPSVYWLTQDFNTTARRLYDRVGLATPFVKYQRPSG